MNDYDPLICGHQIQRDASSVGHCWRNIDARDLDVGTRVEIEGEIIDGVRETCDDFVASNGIHYRW